MGRIVVLDDDARRVDMYKALSRSGHSIVVQTAAFRFLAALRAAPADLVLIGMQTPGMDGEEVIRVLRGAAETSRLLIVAVSSERSRTTDIVGCLQAGADEFLVEPIDPEFLAVRIGALLRRLPGLPPPSPALKLGPLAVLPGERLCRVGGKEVELTRLEFDVLLLFLRQANRVMTRSLLRDTVWKGGAKATARTISRQVQTLRKKLGVFGRRIETVVRVGYVLRA